MHIVIITGMSGSGKTLALNTLEDQGYYCIDNLPPELLPALFKTNIQRFKKLAIGIDIRSGIEPIQLIPEQLKTLKQQHPDTHIVYLYAEKSILKKRYNETRRRHPLANGDISLDQAIDEEDRQLGDISHIADLRIDTSSSDIYELSHFLRTRVCVDSQQGISLMFQSFGFKHASPTDSDYIFDVRCLPNPYWEHALRAYTGQDDIIKNWLAGYDEVTQMQNDIQHYLEKWIPVFEKNQKPYMTISIGCTGGKHRSVYVAEKLVEHFRPLYPNTLLYHREISKNKAH